MMQLSPQQKFMEHATIKIILSREVTKTKDGVRNYKDLVWLVRVIRTDRETSFNVPIKKSYKASVKTLGKRIAEEL